MQPLSPRVRASYLYTFILLFIVVLPMAIMYADGWRWSGELGFYKTGGVFVAVPYQDADISLNGKPIGRSSFFNRSFYVSNLAPGSYVVHVERDEYLPWNRVVVVEPQIVTDTQVLLFPKRIEPIHMTVSTSTSPGSVSSTEYTTLLAAFGTTTVAASTTIPQDVAAGIGLFVVDGNVFARWMSEDAFPPSRFCIRPSSCEFEIPVEQGNEVVRTARFFRGGVVYATQEGNVYFSEMDLRPAPLSARLFQVEGADIRVVDEDLVVKSGDELYRISL